MNIRRLKAAETGHSCQEIFPAARAWSRCRPARLECGCHVHRRRDQRHQGTRQATGLRSTMPQFLKSIAAAKSRAQRSWSSSRLSSAAPRKRGSATVRLGKIGSPTPLASSRPLARC